MTALPRLRLGLHFQESYFNGTAISKRNTRQENPKMTHLPRKSVCTCPPEQWPAPIFGEGILMLCPFLLYSRNDEETTCTYPLQWPEHSLVWAPPTTLQQTVTSAKTNNIRKHNTASIMQFAASATESPAATLVKPASKK